MHYFMQYPTLSLSLTKNAFTYIAHKSYLSMTFIEKLDSRRVTVHCARRGVLPQKLAQRQSRVERHVSNGAKILLI